jgi:hypothetical protein
MKLYLNHRDTEAQTIAAKVGPVRAFLEEAEPKRKLDFNFLSVALCLCGFSAFGGGSACPSPSSPILRS